MWFLPLTLFYWCVCDRRSSILRYKYTYHHLILHGRMHATGNGWGRSQKGDNGVRTERFRARRIRHLAGNPDTGNWYGDWSLWGQHPSWRVWLLPWQWGACAVLLGRLGQPEPCRSSAVEGGPDPAGLSPACATRAERGGSAPAPLESRLASRKVCLLLGEASVIVTRALST